MILDNLFVAFGSAGTAAALFGILAVMSLPAVGAVACPFSPLRRIQPRGR